MNSRTPAREHVTVAVLTGAELDGVAGVFLAVPIVAIATVIYPHWANGAAARVLVDATPLRTPAQVHY